VSAFSVETYQNEYLPIGATEVNAIVSITCEGEDGTPAARPEAAEILLLDVSGSMGGDRKLELAKRAAAAAIDELPDDVHFAVVAGNDRARMVFPQFRRLARSSAATRAHAKSALTSLNAGSGTAIGTWLARAADLFAKAPDAICHAILLTDGRNDPAENAHLRDVVRESRGRFQCDCRGVGTDWEVAQLREIASELLGTVDIIPEPDAMPMEFRALIAQAMTKRVADLSLEIWSPEGASVANLSQVAPSIEDLTPHRSSIDARTGAYPTGAWGNESRDYHLRVTVPCREPGAEMQAARLRLVVDGEVVAQSRARAVWTEDVALSTKLNREVAHYTGQVELAQAIQDGLAANSTGDLDTATARLGRAYQLAAASGNDATLKLLGRIVEVEDAATGTVRLRNDAELVDRMMIDTRSTKTVRVHKPAET
jgi:hypothetical protein